MRTHIAFDSKRYEQAIIAGHGPALIRELGATHGISFDSRLGEQEWVKPGTPVKNWGLACDAQPQLALNQNSGIPAFLANFLDPRVIKTLLSPMKAELIVGSTQKGDWLTQTAMFLTAEQVGETSAYDDFSNDGISNVNVNFPQRQNFVFQAFMRYGERELGIAGLAKLDWAAQQQDANAVVLMKQLNDIFFFGVAGLQNYGLLNDPALYPSLTPQFSWLTSSSATAYTIYQDVVRMFQQLQAQSNGVIDNDSPMTLAMSPTQEVALNQVTLYFATSVITMLKTNFPKLRIETAVQYSTPAGQLVQLIANEVEGQRTAECAYSSKMMAHAMVVESSSWKQKRSSGGYGTIIYRPYAIVSMLG